MIDYEKLKPVLEGYKKYFPEHWNDEKFKWQAVKHFREYWDIDAENFGKMFKKATEKTKNINNKSNTDLLASGYWQPKDMILKFAEADNEATRQMFRDLYNEDEDLAVRVERFENAAKEMFKKYYNGTGKNHHQHTNAISTYLWLEFPDKYYIYRYELAHKTALALDSEHIPKANGSAESMIEGFKLYDEIREAAMKDEEICLLIRNAAAEEGCWKDEQLHTAAIDIVFYLNEFYLDEKNKKENDGWLPKDYAPGLSVENWAALLNDNSIFTIKSLQIVKRMKDYGGQATCTQLSAKYGESVNFYNSGSTALAKRIAEKTGCNLMQTEDNDYKWWPVLYTGRAADKGEEGSFVWRMREELSEALENTDLSYVPLYEDAVTENPDLEKYTKEDFLNEVYMTAERYEALKELLLYKRNVILQGAPGVGKTFSAKKLAYSIMGKKDDSRIELIQFHQNYSYEDFIMGYRPDEDGFKLTEGIFYRFCKLASDNRGKEYFFIIDEINRGNLSKIFGELLMLIEKDYRDTKAVLAYTGEEFAVPDNLFIIGMMNTADRSLAMIDYALRRRFSFFEIEPGFNSEGFKKYQQQFESETFNALIEQIKKLNKAIADDKSLGKGFRIGHSYFCGIKKNEFSVERLRSVVEFDILSMLNEYWFDEPKNIKDWENNLRGVFND